MWYKHYYSHFIWVFESDGYLRPNQTDGPVRIETIVDWDSVVHRYLAIKGQEEDIDLGMTFDDDEKSHGGKLKDQNGHTPKTNGIKNNHVV